LVKKIKIFCLFWSHPDTVELWVALSKSKQLFTEQGGNKLGASPDAFALLGGSGLF